MKNCWIRNYENIYFHTDDPCKKKKKKKYEKEVTSWIQVLATQAWEPLLGLEVWTAASPEVCCHMQLEELPHHH